MDVVAGIFIKESRVLLFCRNPGRSYGGHWEFPGGKVHAGESFPEALCRELFEELRVHVEVGAYVGKVKQADITVHFYVVSKNETEFQLTDHSAIQWVDLSQDQGPEFKWVPADLVILPELRRHMQVSR